jgi:hypothetical protein
MASLSNNSKKYLIQSLQERVEKNKCNCINEQLKHYLELYSSKLLNEDGTEMRARQAEERLKEKFGLSAPSADYEPKTDSFDISLDKLRTQYKGGYGSGDDGAKLKQQVKSGLSGTETQKGPHNILLGDTDNEGIAAAAGSYLGGAGLSIFGPTLEKMMKMSGLKVAKQFLPRSFLRQFAKGPGTQLATAIGTNVLGQMQQLSGYDFVNQNLANIAKSQTANIMGGSGKPFAPILIPSQKKTKK